MLGEERDGGREKDRIKMGVGRTERGWISGWMLFWRAGGGSGGPCKSVDSIITPYILKYSVAAWSDTEYRIHGNIMDTRIYMSICPRDKERERGQGAKGSMIE